jgi:formamidopyrimidine-DNA glycosylase
VPELPDVEIFRRTLAHSSLHREIERVRVRDRTMLRDVSERKLAAVLRGRSLERTHRHGKHLLVEISDHGLLALRFGMTGFLATGVGNAPPERHLRLVLGFADGHWLALVDQRRLGRIALTDTADDYLARERLGPDALSLSAPELRDILRASRGSVKSTLMDQERVAGLGNIYTDELLFHARVDPTSRAAHVDDAACRRLHRQLHRVVDLAIQRNADPDRFPRTWLLPHRQDGAACPRGNGTVRPFRSGGRTGYWCPSCQRGANDRVT